MLEIRHLINAEMSFDNEAKLGIIILICILVEMKVFQKYLDNLGGKTKICNILFTFNFHLQNSFPNSFRPDPRHFNFFSENQIIWLKILFLYNIFSCVFLLGDLSFFSFFVTHMETPKILFIEYSDRP